ncbi:N-acetylmuramidase family protein [bacterium]|nr:N-acetylmuramidase family protein [bacterium]
MTKRTPVTRDTLIRLWNEEPRKVPLAVMLTTAELESGIGSGRYDATAERYEEHLKARRQDWSAADCTSYGLFQILGINWRSIGIEYAIYPDQHIVFVAGTSPLSLDDLLRVQMRAYDRFMGALIRKHGLPKAFRIYNGAGPAADRYRDRAQKVQARLTKDLVA